MLELASIHIPKTAGRTFLEIINAVYGNEHVAHFDRKNYPKGSEDAVAKFISGLTPGIRVIHGHFFYSDIRPLNSDGNIKVITWLRDPVERVISNFSFFKKRISLAPDDPELQKRKDETILEYAALQNSRNRMCKFMEGLNPEEFFFVGIMEYFDEDISRLAKMLHWPEINIPHVNDNSVFRSLLPEVTEKERQIIRDLNRADMELYDRILSYRKSNAV